ncbi:MAG: hypothetical protein WC992_04020 [Acholeplasmataceae bacterium]|jgi:hypothetical protein
MTQHRYSFNAGEIAPELAWRSDLAKYPNACVTLENFLVAPYGGVERRPPWEVRWQHVLGPSYAALGNRTRMFPFLGAGESRYVVILTLQSTATVVRELRIYDATASGDADALADLSMTSELGWFYGIDEIPEIQFIQSYDVLFLAHPKHPVVRLERHAHDDWRVREHEFAGGPFLPANTDPSSILSPVVPEWDAATEYEPGQVVVLGDEEVGLEGAVTWVFWYYVYATWNDSTGFTPDRAYYRAVLPTTSPHSFEVGDLVTISGTTYYDGQWEVLATSASTITINVGTYYSNALGGWANHWAETFAAPDSVRRAGAAGFYESIASSTNKEPDAEPTYWRSTPVYRGSVTIEATEAVFSASMVGGKLRLNHPRKTHFYQANANAPSPATDEHMDTFDTTGQASVAIPVYGSVTLTTAEGRWGGTLELQKSLNAGATWETIGAINSGNADYNGTISRDIEEMGAVVRVHMKLYKAPSSTPTGCMWRLEITTYSDAAIVTITGYTDTRHVTASTDNYLYSREGTSDWEEGTFSPKNGYPAAICFHEERLVVAGVAVSPYTVYGSAVNDWHRFMRGTLETSPIVFSLAASSVERIRWLSSKQHLHIGTDLAEWTMGSRDSERILSGETIAVERHTEYGSAAVQALSVGDTIVFVQRNHSAIRAIKYNYEMDGFTAPNLTVLAPQVLENGVLQMVYQRAPTTRIWVLSRSHEVSCLTYEDQENVRGWSRHPVNAGAVPAALCCVPDDTPLIGDTIWAVIGDPEYKVGHLCRLRPTATDRVDLDLCIRQQFTVSSPPSGPPRTGWLFYQGPRTGEPDADDLIVIDTEGNIRRFEDDYTLGVFTWVTPYPATLVEVLPNPGSTYTIGCVGRFRYESVLEPTAFMVPSDQGRGTGATTRIDEADLYLVDSRGGEVSLDGGENWEPLAGLTADVSGEVTVRQNSGYKREARLIVRTSDLCPVHVAALGVRVRRYD